MTLTQEQLNDEHFEFNINTGYIHSDLCNNWSNYSRELFEEIEWKLERILWHKKLITVPYDEGRKNYLEGKMKMYESYKEYKNHPGNPYFMEYFMQPQGEGFALISFSENCLLTLAEDKDFDLFFALKLTLIDLMDMHEFLTYQLAANFERNKGKFKIFLTTLLLKHKSLLERTSIPEVVNNFIAEELIVKPESQEKISHSEEQEAQKQSLPEKQEDPTSRQHVIAMHLLMEALGTFNYDRTALAKFVQFFSGKETGAKSITNTGIYAYAKAPFDISKPELVKALETIRPYFKALGLERSLAELDRRLELASTSKKK